MIKSIPKIIRNDWIIALFLLILYLVTNGYTLGWDDQHLEIPLLKSLIDPSLYAGDYYVESLKKNFPSLLYPVLAHLIRIEHIPATYFILFLVSRYFLFWGMYKIWQTISGQKFPALLCTVSIMILGRVEEFLYRTFSHQELALGIIFAGMSFFYKERFILSAILLGVAANFHLLYSFFPFLFMFMYLLTTIRRHGMAKLLKVTAAFGICALPVALVSARKHVSLAMTADSDIYQNWMDLYLIACPQNFLFVNIPLNVILKNSTAFFQATKAYWVLAVFYALNMILHPRFRRDKKVQASILTGFALIVLSFIFTYVFPVRFVLDLNLVRNEQFILFFLMGYTTLLLWDEIQKSRWSAAGLGILFSLIRFGNYLTVFTGITLIGWIGLSRIRNRPRPWTVAKKMLTACLGLCLAIGLWGLKGQFLAHRYNPAAMITLSGIVILLLANAVWPYVFRHAAAIPLMRRLILLIPLLGFSANFVFYHGHHVRIEKTAPGFWQLQRNWIDMQNYCRTHTPKDALFLIPNDMEMGGFRIFSERKVICDYRDCGIIGFDYKAAVEWQRRLNDISTFKVIVDGPITKPLANAMFKYKANYVIFMRYMNPEKNPYLAPVYQNQAFSLYKVLINPLKP